MNLVIIILALASAIVAQDLGALPDCAKNCVAEFTTGSQIGDCARLDAKCVCASDSFISGIACCLAGVCNADEQKQAVDFARSFCSTQGVTDLPQSVTCAQTPLSNSTTTPTATGAPSVTATPNAGSPAGSGFSAGVYGSLLALLAML
ncbi:hypothetical protein E0Z10_g547 [Xylaria hypoxylon]|uniref:CFEM domain-containing protein n=1 Tax=Xylaria hypoxylon TaxID=37992 RepID=A0A4Z0Z7K1_9PEZI|nr:hypothetical protein E0Z10_g547 [Xylaria hypoxylon]